MKKAGKILLIILLSFLGLIAIVLFTAPRAAQSFINENSKEMLGRQIDVGKIRLNYVTLALKIDDFTMYEVNDTDVFVSFDRFKVNLQLIPSLKGNYTISSFLLDDFEVNVQTDGEHFNFDDLVAETDTTVVIEEPVDTMPPQEICFSLNNFVIKGGNISYYDSKEDIHHQLSNFGFVIPEFYWDNKVSSPASLNFKFEPQGELNLRADVDYATKSYRLTARIIDLALEQFSVYLKPMLASEGIVGTLNSEIHVNGSIEHPSNVVVSGQTELSDFMLRDANGDSIFQNALLGLYLDSINIANNYYGVRKLLISAPWVNVALYKETNTFDKLFAPMMEAMEDDSLAVQSGETDDTVEVVPVYFRVDTILLEKGAVFLADHSLNRPFIYGVTSIHTLVTNITHDADNVPVNYSLVLNRDGKLSGDVGFSMAHPGVFTYDGVLAGLNLTSFSPYSEFYVARPINRGNFQFKGEACLTEDEFVAENNLRINDIEMGEKISDAPTVNLPINLALGILKDKNGDVEVDLPMSGDPSDPDFSIGKIVVKTLTNFIVKVASKPFDIVADIDGVDPERLQELPLVFSNFELSKDNKERLDEIALALEKKPELMFRLTLEVPIKKAEEALGIYIVKKRYIAAQKGDETYETESEWYDAIKKLKNKNEDFLSYVSQNTSISPDSALYQRCIDIVGKDKVKQGIITLTNKRHEVITSYLYETLKVDKSSVEVCNADIFNQRIEVEKPRYRVEVSVK